jgi:hypothetical protein
MPEASQFHIIQLNVVGLRPEQYGLVFAATSLGIITPMPRFFSSFLSSGKD